MPFGDGTRLRRSRSAIVRRCAKATTRRLPPPKTSAFDPAHVAFAARGWTLKAEEEYRSAATFSEITAGLIQIGAPLDLIDAFVRITRDELGHAALCTDLAERFGAPQPKVELWPIRDRMHGKTRAEATWAMLLVEGAIGETISCGYFGVGRRTATEPCTRAALGAILRDEARHARVSWEAMTILWPELEEEEKRALEREASAGLGAIEHHTILPLLRRLDEGETFEPALSALGVLSLESRVEAFYAAVEEGVRPRLAKLGMDAARVWDERYRPPIR